MKSFYLILSIIILASCSQDASKTNRTPTSNPSEAMSYGNDSSLQSRVMFEYMRLRNPLTGMIPANIRSQELAFAQTLPRNMKKSYTWEQRGPVNKGGRTRAVAIDVLDENIWLAAGVTGGIWRSVDAGENWEKVTNPLQMHSITSIAQDTRVGHENVWYAGTGEHYGIVSASAFLTRASAATECLKVPMVELPGLNSLQRNPIHRKQFMQIIKWILSGAWSLIIPI